MVRLVLAIVIVLAGCKDKENKPEPPPPEPKVLPAGGSGSGSGSAPAPAPVTPVTPATPAKLGADWPEQTGDGFAVRAPAPPRMEKKTGNAAAGGTFEATFYLGFGIDPANDTRQVAFYDVEDEVKLTDEELIAQMREGYVAMCDAATIKQAKVTVGDVGGDELQCAGSHPQLGAFRLRVRFLVRKRRLWVVQALASEKSKYYAGDPFVESFRFAP
jgi:hypothetical protein